MAVAEGIMEGRQRVMDLGHLPEFILLVPAGAPKCIWSIYMMASVI